MKKFLFSVAFISVIANISFAQEGSEPFAAAGPVRNKTLWSEVKINAIRNLEKQYHGVAATWSTKEDGFRARFSQDDIKYTIDFDKKGKWVSSIRVYNEKNLSTQLRKMVKSIYFDYTIVKIIELKVGKTLVHFVEMETPSSLLTLHIMNREITEIENYKNVTTVSHE